MLIKIELCAGRDAQEPHKSDIQKNIDALRRVVDGKTKTGVDDVLILDTISVLEGIKKRLPD